MSELNDATLFDSHCHLDEGTWEDGVQSVIARARSAGIREMVTIGGGADLDYARAAIARAETDPAIWATVGIHPHDAKSVDSATLNVIEDLASHSKVVAIGEAGLDYYYDSSPRQTQQDLLREFVRMCHRVQKPLVIHCREAFEDLLQVLDAESGHDLKVVIHCFTGTRAEADACLERGFWLSIPGIVTFKRSGDIPEVARSTPLNRLMIETDSPYLAPVPRRGRKNEPANLIHTARFIASLRGLPLAEFAEATTATARQFYGLA